MGRPVWVNKSSREEEKKKKKKRRAPHHLAHVVSADIALAKKNTNYFCESISGSLLVICVHC